MRTMTIWTSEGPEPPAPPAAQPRPYMASSLPAYVGSVPTAWGPEEAEFSQVKMDGWVTVCTGQHPFL